LDIAEDRPRPPRPRRDFKSSPERRTGGGPRHADDLPAGDFDRQEYYDRGSYGRDEYGQDDDHGGRGGKSFGKPKRPKGSRRGLRAKKRSL